MIYLDNNATTKPAEEVVDAMKECLEEYWFNPSAFYQSAQKTREYIENAREQVAQLVGAYPDEIIFTSGGTEATNMVIDTWAYGHKRSGNEEAEENVHDEEEGSDSWPIVVTPPTEHSSTLKSLSVARKRGKCGLSIVEVDSAGIPLISAWKESMDFATAASFCLANNETGIISPAELLIKTCHSRYIPVHIDAVQAVGKIPVNFHSLGTDYASLSAHKFHGPKGIGALYVRRGEPLEPLFFGGGQEYGKRPGTQNVPGIIGFGVAAKLAYQELAERKTYMTRLRDKFESSLLRELPNTYVNGSVSPRLPNTSNIRFEGCTSEGMMILLNAEEIYCSIASACKTGSQEASTVLTAMGLTAQEAKSSLRFSFSAQNTEQEIDTAIEAIVRCVHKLRGVQSEHTGPVLVYNP